MKSKMIWLCLVLLPFGLMGQEGKKVTAAFDHEPMASVLQTVEDQTGYAVYYDATWIDSLTYSGSFDQAPIDSVLSAVLGTTGLVYYVSDHSVFLTKGIKIIDQPAISQALSRREETETDVALGLLFTREYLNVDNQGAAGQTILEIGDRNKLKPGATSTIAGYIKDSETNEPLAGVVVYSKDPSVASSSDMNGFFSIALPNGKRELIVQYVGMKTTKQKIVLYSDGQFNIDMVVDVIALQEVMIESESAANVEDVLIGVSKIDVQETKNVPMVLGENDIMKIATTFAGVQTMGEGSSGFNVRGGKSDQNLVLLNGATIYNASHFFGFFSVFNSNAIQSMDVYKSGIPAAYGGRLSSVFDVESKKADVDKFKGEGGISPITAKLTVEVPVIKGKSGLMLGGRTTYSNWLLKKVGNADFSENEVFFADGIMRYDHQINDNNDVVVSGYYSTDKFRISSDTLFSFSNFSYKNGNASVKWNHRFGNQLDGSLSAVYSAYGYDLAYDESPPNNFVQDFGINEATVLADLAYYADDVHTLRGGVQLKRYQINPGTKSPQTSESVVRPVAIDDERALETTVFLSDEYILTDRLTLYGGYRYSFFTNYGPQTVNNYQPGTAKNPDTVIGETVYEDGEAVQFYHGGEVRVNARFALDDESSVKASYNRTRQYLHTLTNSASLSPTDTWRLSSKYIKPQVADQYTLGYYRNFKSNMIETSVEVYYKDMDNLIDFKVGSQFLLNPNIEMVALQGPGRSYGVEFSVKKSGRLNGWINYAFARSFIQLDSSHPEEVINNGKEYPANFDMPHTVNMVANYKITKRWSFSCNFTYNTGRPVTYPVGVYDFKGMQAVHYSERNAFRMPDYIRLDVGLNLEASHKIAQLAHSYWSFSIYNVLGRDNPYSIFFDIRDGQVNGYKLVVFPTPIPTISYNFRF